MALNKPNLPSKLTYADHFLMLAQQHITDEELLYAIQVDDISITGADFRRLELEQSIIENSVFNDSNFERATFMDVVFRNCDFSNSKFLDAYFVRCEFINCKCVGLNMNDAIIKHTLFENVNLTFSSFDNVKFVDVMLKESDLTEVSIAESTLQRFKASKSRFIKNNFFKTKLKGVDFTDNELIAPTISSPPTELNGAKINSFQAADLIRLWGVIVE